MGNALDLSTIGGFMAGAKNESGDSGTNDVVIRKGERIPRRSAPPFEEATSFANAIKRDGFFGTAMDDKNQYGPVAMMVLLLIFATITGIMIKILPPVLDWFGDFFGGIFGF
tara:strand:- start:1231 stop:1566 length:336 start_codon:yes stop_codon:yes gene_type:complete